MPLSPGTKVAYDFANIKASLDAEKVHAPKNRFHVIFTKPAKLTTSIDTSKLAIMCKEVSFTGKRIMTAPGKAYRSNIKYPYYMDNDEVGLRFILGENYTAKRFFDQWIDHIYNRNTKTVNYQDDIRADIEIYQLNKKDEVVYGEKLEHVYPVQMSEVNMSNDASDLQEVSVTLVYSKYTLIT